MKIVEFELFNNYINQSTNMELEKERQNYLSQILRLQQELNFAIEKDKTMYQYFV